MKSKDVFPKIRFGDLYPQIILLIAFLLSLFFKLWSFAVFFICALILSFLFTHFSSRKSALKIKHYLENAALHVGMSESMPGFPFPAVSVNTAGKITWYNSSMDKLMEGDLLFQKDITELVKCFDIKHVTEDGKYPVWKTELKNGTYSAFSHRITTKNPDDDLIMVYFLNITEQEQAEKSFRDSRFVSMAVAFDNYEEVMQGLSDEARNSVQSSIERNLQGMTSEADGIFKKTERDRYSIYLSNQALQSLINKKFPILDAAREIQNGNSIAPTLSIGIGVEGDSFNETDMFARAALDMALGRGGDQVVIKDKNQILYFGGKTREVEKRTKVKSRVIAVALRELILQSDNVIITGHKNADIDCIGAAMGIVSIARFLGKKAYIIQNECDDTAKEVVKKAIEDDVYKNVFLKRASLEDVLLPKSVLIIVDTNSPSYMELNDLLGLTEQIVLIDHHRRSADFIENPTLQYHEPYASSTCEMITEMLPYICDKNILIKVEAEALYSGIYLDTKCFTFKTGVRTLEAAAYLRRAGIDPITVKQYFKSNLETFTMRAGLIQGAKVVKDHIAISVADEVRTPSVIAQAADELLNISGIDTSFVIAKHENACVISGRSTGTINVQVILEHLGGGGHFSVAGAQVRDSSPAEVENQLMEIIETYLNEQ
ncbi:MAG: DHH family phosphoesterase [Clostridia bacterium]|nr:DHH family phosphoesterase [Clostridia bacterium]